MPARSVIASSGCSGSDCFIGRFINVWHGAGDGEHRPQTQIQLSRSDHAPCVRVSVWGTGWRLDGQWPGRPPILLSKIPEQRSFMFLFIKHQTINEFFRKIVLMNESRNEDSDLVRQFGDSWPDANLVGVVLFLVVLWDHPWHCYNIYSAVQTSNTFHLTPTPIHCS